MKIFKTLLPWFGLADFILMVAVGTESVRLIVFEGVRTWYPFGVLYFILVLTVARFMPVLSLARKRIQLQRQAHQLAARIAEAHERVAQESEKEKTE